MGFFPIGGSERMWQIWETKFGGSEEPLLMGFEEKLWKPN